MAGHRQPVLRRALRADAVSGQRPARQRALQARRDYIVQDGQVIIVDEFTGRLMYGRRYSEGLHQAIEAKEGVKVQARNPDPGHHHLPELLPHVPQAGGHDRYGRDREGGVRQDLQPESWPSPRTVPMIRKDLPDVVFNTETAKFKGGGRRDRELQQAQAAGAGRHGVHRNQRDAVRTAASARAFRTRCSTPRTTSVRP